jgi:hypothetical protein
MLKGFVGLVFPPNFPDADKDALMIAITHDDGLFAATIINKCIVVSIDQLIDPNGYISMPPYKDLSAPVIVLARVEFLQGD